jgi:nickel transport protein
MGRSIVIFRSAIWLLPGLLAGHELETTASLAAPAVIVRAAYGGSEAVSFSKVEVFSPQEPAQPFQTGLTDRRGYVSFVPDSSGVWRVVVDDEEGHRRDLPITVPDPFRSDAQIPAVRSSRVERAMLGVALMVGGTGFLYGFKARRRT